MRDMANTLKMTKDVFAQMLEIASKGGTLDAICAVANVDRSTLYKFLEANPPAKSLFSQARDKGMDELAESLLIIPDTYEDPAKARLKSENIRWLLARRAASRYGDRLEMNVNGSIDLNAALNEATKRLMSDSARTIDAERVTDTITYEESPADNQSASEPEPDIFG